MLSPASDSEARPTPRQGGAQNALPAAAVADLVQSIVESEHFGPALKPVLDGGIEKLVTEELRSLSQRNHSEIEDICGFHAQEFIESVEELLAVRQELVSLRDDIKQINQTLQGSGKTLLSQAGELQKVRSVQLNIAATADVLAQCILCLKLADMLQNHIRNRRFFHALKVLEQLQGEDGILKAVQQFSFALLLKEDSSLLQNAICTEVLADFNLWLANSWNQASMLGQRCMEETSRVIHMEQQLNQRQQTQVAAYRGMIRASFRDGDESAVQDESSKLRALVATKTSQEKENLSKADDQPSDEGVLAGMDFTPLYQCLYIYDRLQRRSEFQAYYRENRRLQATKLFQVREGTLTHKGFLDTLHQVAGFFAVEHVVRETTYSLLPPSATRVNLLWSLAVGKVKAMVQELMTTCESAESFIEAKDTTYLFAQTARSYGYDTSSLIDHLGKSARSYTELVLRRCDAQWEKILLEDTWNSLIVRTPEELQQLVISNDLSSNHAVNQMLHFSVLVPRVYNTLKQHVTDFFAFARNLGDLGDLLTRTTDTAIQQFVSRARTFMKRPTFSPQMAIQLCVNMHHLSPLSQFLMRMIAELSEGSWAPVLNSKQDLETLKAEAEKQIYVLNDQRIDDLFSKWTGNWVASDKDVRTSLKEDLHPFVTDVAAYLQVLFSLLPGLPVKLQQDVYARAFRRIADCMMGLFTNDSVKRITLPAIQTFLSDIQFVEDIAQKNPAVRNAVFYFTELRQLVSLLLSPNLDDFLDEKIRDSNYYLLTDLHRLVSILEKVRSEETSIFKKDSKSKSIKRLISELRQRIKTQQKS